MKQTSNGTFHLVMIITSSSAHLWYHFLVDTSTSDIHDICSRFVISFPDNLQSHSYTIRSLISILFVVSFPYHLQYHPQTTCSLIPMPLIVHSQTTCSLIPIPFVVPFPDQQLFQVRLQIRCRVVLLTGNAGSVFQPLRTSFCSYSVTRVTPSMADLCGNRSLVVANERKPAAMNHQSSMSSIEHQVMYFQQITVPIFVTRAQKNGRLE